MNCNTKNSKVQSAPKHRGLTDEERIISDLLLEPMRLKLTDLHMNGEDISSKICRVCYRAAHEIVSNHPQAASEPDSETYEKLLIDAVERRGICALGFKQFTDGLYSGIVPQPLPEIDLINLAKEVHAAAVKRRYERLLESAGDVLIDYRKGEASAEEVAEAMRTATEAFQADSESVKGEGEFEFLHPSEIDEPVEVEWWWKNFIPKQVIVILSALPKTGKTTLLRAVIAQMEKGGACCGQRVEPCKVLYVSEEGKRTWKPRLAQFCIGDHVLLSCVPFLGRPTMPDFRRYLREVERIIKDQNIGIVVFDTASKLLPIGKENDSDDVDPAMGELSRLTEAGATVVVVHHDRKSGGDPVSRMRGSLSYAASSDVILSLEKMKNAERDDPRRVLYGDGRFDEVESELVIEFDGSNFIADGSRAEVKRLDVMKIISDICGVPEPGMKADDIWKSWPEDKLIARPKQTKFYDILKQGAESDPPVWKRSGTGKRGSPFLFRVSPLGDGSRMNKSDNQLIHSYTHSIGGRINNRGISDEYGIEPGAEQNDRLAHSELIETTTNRLHNNGFTDRHSGDDDCPI